MIATQKTSNKILLWLFAGVLAVALAFVLDARVDSALEVSKSFSMSRFASLCSKMGEGWATAAFGIFFAVAFFAARRPPVAAKIFFVALTSEITGFVGLLLRIVIGRTRPLAHAAQGFYGPWHDGHWIIGRYEFSAFPSGHAATVVGFAVAAWMVNRGWGAVAAVYALSVMWSRIALQAHHLSDVVASAALAIPLAVLAKKFLLPTLEFQFGNLYRAISKRRTARL